MKSFRERIAGGECLIGTFLKTPDPRPVEILALAGMDFVVADQEHAPIGVGDLDLISLAGRAAGIPVLFRAQNRSDASISPALDLGCIGVMAPHIRRASEAAELAAAVKYAHGARGFSPSSRSGKYGTFGLAHREVSDRNTSILAQIEDKEALDHLDAIAAQPDIDVLFVGPMDLAISMGCAPGSPEMDVAIGNVVAASSRAGKAAGLFVGDPNSIPSWVDRGVSVFVCGSDQSLLLSGARAALATSKNQPVRN